MHYLTSDGLCVFVITLQILKLCHMQMIKVLFCSNSYILYFSCLTVKDRTLVGYQIKGMIA